MNSSVNAVTAYGHFNNPTKTDRGIEFDLLANITRRLKAESDGSNARFPALCAAVHQNRQLWATLAADVSDPSNGLSQDLRSKIFYLSEFVNKYSRRVLNERQSIDALVDVNLAVMRGLSPSDNL